MTPAAAIDALNRQLAAHGQDAVLRRSTWAGTTRVDRDLTVRISLRGYRPEELVGGIIQGDSVVVLGPTEIAAAGWPAGIAEVPQEGDQIIADGRSRSIIAAAPIHLSDELVRIDLQVRG